MKAYTRNKPPCEKTAAILKYRSNEEWTRARFGSLKGLTASYIGLTGELVTTQVQRR